MNKNLVILKEKIEDFCHRHLIRKLGAHFVESGSCGRRTL